MSKCDVLVTGATGFIGQYLCEYLVNCGLKVIGIDKRNADVPFELICHDLTQALPKRIETSACVHLASSVGGILYNYSAKEAMLVYNAAINGNVVELCKQGGCEHLIFFSSINVFESDPIFTHGPITTYPASTAYAQSKADGERLFAGSFKNTVVVRPTNVFGKRQTRTHDLVGESHVIPDLIKKIQDNDVVQVMGDGTQRRNFVHVTDIVAFVEKALRFEGQHYINLRSNLTITIAALAAELAELLNRNVRFEFEPTYMKLEAFQIRDFDLAPAVRLGWAPGIHSIIDGLKL